MWKKGSLILACVMMSVLVLSGCGKSNDASTTTTQTTTEATTEATTTTPTTGAPLADNMTEVTFNNIKFNVPKDWMFVKQNDKQFYYYPNGSANYFISLSQQTQIKGAVIGDNKKYILQGMSQSGTDMNITNSDDTKVGGMNGFKLECTWKPDGVTQYKSNGVIFINSTGVYSLLYSSTKLDGSPYDADIQKVIDSIQEVK